MTFKEKEPTTASIEATKLWVNHAFRRILGDWHNSDEVLSSETQFQFQSGTVSEITKKAASGALRRAYDKGEIYFFVQNETYNIDTCYKVGFTKPYAPQKEEELLVAVLPWDFINRCQKEGTEPISVFEQCMRDLIFSDIEAASSERKRAQYFG